MRLFCILLARELRLYVRNRRQVGQLCVFFLLAVALFPFGIGAEPHLLRQVAPGVIWVIVLFTSMLSLGQMFEEDEADGSLEQLLLPISSAGAVLLAKWAAHWLSTGVPLAALVPVAGLLLGMDAETCLRLSGAVALGSLVLTIAGSMGAVLTVGLGRSGVVQGLVVLPFTIPALIFGAGSMGGQLQSAGNADPYLLHMLLLSGEMFMLLPLALLIGMYGLRHLKA